MSIPPSGRHFRLKTGFVSREKSASTHRHVVRSAGIIGGFTGISRVLGFLRDMIIAAAFGTGIGAEAFVVSFKLPNLLRDLVGEGAANAAFVPVFTECREKKPADFWTLVSTMLWIMGGVLLVLSVLGMLFAPHLVALLAPGFVTSADPDKYPLAVSLTRFIFPYLFLIGLSALAMGVLNSLKEFASSALGPALLNLCMITAGVFFEKQYGPFALAAGVLAGGVLQLACQAPPLLRKGFELKKPDFGHEYVKKIGRLLVPRALGSGLYQINILVDSVLASFETIVGAGGQSALYYANRLFQLPLAIFGLSLAQAVLPAFSTQMARDDREGFRKTLAMAIRSLFFVMVPASAGLLVLCGPIVKIIFEHGEFDAYSTSITSGALFYYSFGLLSCALIKIFANAFYAMQDTRTPVKAMLISVSLNAAMSCALMFPMKLAGLTLASTISATINMGLLYHFLVKRTGALDAKAILVCLAKVLAAAAVMGAFAFAFHQWILLPSSGAGRWAQAALLLTGIGLSIGVYFAASILLKIEEAQRLLPRRERTP